MIEKGKCLNCLNDIYAQNCHFQCPHCGYAENWSEELTYQLDKEESNERMPRMRMQLQKERKDNAKEKNIKDNGRIKKINEKIHIKSWK